MFNFLNYFNLYTTPPFFSAALFILLGFFVLIKSRDKKIGFSFFVLCFLTFWWQFSWFILFNTTDKVFASLLVKIGYSGIIFIPLGLFWFFTSFTKNNRAIDRVFYWIIISTSLFFEVALWTTKYFINGYYTYFWGFYPRAGILHIAYLVFIVFVLFRVYQLSMEMLLGKKTISPRTRYQIKYLLIALIFYNFAAFDFAINYGLQIYPIGFIFILIFLIIVGYTIIAHLFLGIQVIARKGVVYFFSTCTVVLLIFSAMAVSDNFYSKFKIIAIFIISALAVFSIDYIKDFYYFLANRFFFYSLYDEKKIVAMVNNKIISTLEITKINDFVYKTFSKVFGITFFCILKYSRDNGRYFVFYKRGDSLKKDEQVRCDTGLETGTISKTEILTAEDLKSHFIMVKRKKSEDDLVKKEVEMLVPLALNGKIIGLMLIGKKASGDDYNKSDAGLFNLVAAQLAAAIESSELYEEISRLNKSLERKVYAQTNELANRARELEKKNENLNKLLEVKNEFLRIVNHQLNTPVSIIKNSVYMIRSGAFPLEKGLSFIDEGVNRMQELFTKFWKAFSFEGEGVEMSFQETDINELLKKLIEDASSLSAVKDKKIAIILKKNNSLPRVKTDPKEITQVISNLLDNAISYTPSGSINISFKTLKDGFLKIYIKDTGAGIDKDDQSKIFEKFIRGARAIRSRPSGSGLGLYIARKIVEANGGELKLEKSIVGKGTTFSFTLPVWK